MSGWRDAQASAAAGVVARVFCHPFDTCKSRLMVQSGSLSGAGGLYRGTLDALRRTWRAEGLRGLYRGFAVTAAGSAPATCLYLTSYGEARRLLRPALGDDSFALSFAAGVAAEAVSCVLWVPIDVVKERLQCQGDTPSARRGAGAADYRGTADALRTILRVEGVAGVYRGYWATLVAFGPFSAFYFLFYEEAKRRLPATPAGFLAASAAAGAGASLVTTPLDLVKLRLQVQRSGGGGVGVGVGAEPYRGVLDGLAQIVRREGGLALFRGAGARLAFHVPSTAITMSAYETIRGWL